MNRELQELFEQDQADRADFEQLDQEQHQQMFQRDRVRRQRVEELLESNALQTAEDYFHAAMIFQHGETTDHIWRAYELASRGVELGHPVSRWLTAAAYDRWLMRQGKPQKYGTQYTARHHEPYRLWDVDPNTTDEERASWEVPPLAEALRQAEDLTRRRGEPSNSGASQKEGPRRFAHFEVPGLRIEIIELDEQFVHRVPDQELPAQVEIPTPESLPRDWKVYRRGEAYLATSADGQDVFVWSKVPQSELTYACKEQEVPQLESVQLGDQAAILLKSVDASYMGLFLRAGDAFYLVGGHVTLNELLQLATTIPGE